MIMFFGCQRLPLFARQGVLMFRHNERLHCALSRSDHRTVIQRWTYAQSDYNKTEPHNMFKIHSQPMPPFHRQALSSVIKTTHLHLSLSLSKTTACAMPVNGHQYVHKWYAYYCAHVSSARNTTTPPNNVFGRCTISLPIASTTKPASMPTQLHLYQVNIIFKFLMPCFTMSFVGALTFHGHRARLFWFCCNSLHRPASFPLSFVGRTPSMRNVFRKRFSFKPLAATCSLHQWIVLIS